LPGDGFLVDLRTVKRLEGDAWWSGRWFGLGRQGFRPGLALGGEVGVADALPVEGVVDAAGVVHQA